MLQSLHIRLTYNTKQTFKNLSGNPKGKTENFETFRINEVNFNYAKKIIIAGADDQLKYATANIKLKKNTVVLKT